MSNSQDLFFAFPFHSVLHGHVDKILSFILHDGPLSLQSLVRSLTVTSARTGMFSVSLHVLIIQPCALLFLLQLFSECSFLSRLLRAYQENEEATYDSNVVEMCMSSRIDLNFMNVHLPSCRVKPRHHRLGYMGFVNRYCNMFQQNSQSGKSLARFRGTLSHNSLPCSLLNR